jgi:uncharacterized protein YndB with AHSA1/START domain
MEKPYKELTISRTFNAPIELVWKVWTDEKHLVHWWAPKGFTNPVCEWNAQSGNKILIHMKGPDGAIYPMDGEFHEIVPRQKIVFTSAALDKNGARLFEVMNTINFSDEGDKTKLTLHFAFTKVKPEGKGHIGGAEMGWNMSLDKLADYLINPK